MSYTWETSTDETLWLTDPQSTTTIGYSFGANTYTSKFYLRRKVIDAGAPGLCNSATSKEVEIDVNADLKAGTIDNSETKCEGEATTLNASLIPVTGGTGTYVYQWKQSIDNGLVWTNATGVSGQINYSAGPLSKTTMFKRTVTSGACGTVETAQITKTINPNLAVSVIITDPVTTCENFPKSFTATPTNGGSIPKYQWYVDNVKLGPNDATFTYTPTAANNGKIVRVELTSSETCQKAPAAPSTTKSNNITLQIQSAVTPSITIYPQVPICVGKKVKLTTKSSGGGNKPKYQWHINGSNDVKDTLDHLDSIFANGDHITVDLTTDLTCATVKTATSNTITMVVNSSLNCTMAIEDNQISQLPKTISTIYNLQGVEVDKIYKGLVIYKYIDGTTQKVIQE